MPRSSDLPFPLSLLRDRSFQACEIRRVIGISMLYLGITTILVGLLYSRLLTSLLDGIAPLLFVSEDAQLAADAVPALGDVLGKWMLAMVAINVLITVVLGIFITRRLGQPILAIKRTLREIGGGNLDVRLRASDSRDFGEIAAELSAAMRSVRAQVAAAKSGIDKVQSLSDLDLIEREKGLETCRTALDYFQVEGRADKTVGRFDKGSENDTFADFGSQGPRLDGNQGAV